MFDGVYNVKRVHVIMLFRDNAMFIERFMIPNWEKIEAMYPQIEFQFHFLENDSSDSTRPLLETFIRSRGPTRAHLYSPPKPLTDTHARMGTSFSRIERMVFLRNTIMSFVRPHIHENDWCLLLDTDIIFEPSILKTMMAHEPRKNGIALLGSATLHGYFVKHVRELLPIEQVRGKSDYDIIPTSHYYDVFAYVDIDGHLLYPRCQYQTCKQCYPNTIVPSTSNTSLPDNVNNSTLRDVRACFGGICFVDSKFLLEKSVKWDTINVCGQFALCEHILFCDRMSSLGGRICIADDTVAYWVNDSSPIRQQPSVNRKPTTSKQTKCIL